MANRYNIASNIACLCQYIRPFLWHIGCTSFYP